MKRISAIIEKGNDGGFAIYSPQVEGVYAIGQSEEEARKEFAEMLVEEAEDVRELTGHDATWFDGRMPEIDYRYSLSGFFEAFPFINATKFARFIGVNPSLMRRYKMGNHGISKSQKETIQASYSDIMAKMCQVRF